MPPMTPEEKKLWQCYHARAMQGILAAPNLNEATPEKIAVWATAQADAMLAEAKKKGAV